MTAVTQSPGPTPPVVLRRSRPLGVVLLALFQLANVAANLAAITGLLGARGGSLVSLVGTEVVVIDDSMVVLSALSLIGAIALWRLNRFGWYAVMLLTGVGLALQLAFYVWATPNYINLTIFVVSAFYLNQREVKELFLTPPAEDERVILEAEDGGLS